MFNISKIYLRSSRKQTPCWEQNADLRKKERSKKQSGETQGETLLAAFVSSLYTFMLFVFLNPFPYSSLSWQEFMGSKILIVLDIL